MSLTQRIGRNTLAKVTGEVLSRGGGFLLFFLLARWLGPEAFGRWSFALSYATLFAVLVDLGTNVIVTRELARAPERLASFVPRLNGLKLVSSLGFLLVIGLTLQDLIDTWIAWKRENDVDPVRLRPHPYEFALYYDC